MSSTRLLTGLSSMALLVVGLVALLPECASACSCMPPRGTEQEQARRELAQSSAVFAGEAVDFEKGGKMWGGDVPSTTVSFRVSEVWKGPERETLEVNTPSQGPACGLRFSEGQEYLVYAWGRKMEVSSCTETKPLSEASADLEALGNGETLGGSGVLSDTSGGFPPLWVIGMVGGVVSLVVLMRVVRTG